VAGRPDNFETAFPMTSRFHTADDTSSLGQPAADSEAVRSASPGHRADGRAVPTRRHWAGGELEPKLRKSRAMPPFLDHLPELVNNIAIGEGTDPCWLWTGTTAMGYAHFRGIPVHRWLLEFWQGEALGPRHAEHRCRNKGCVNPTHLRPATSKQNQENVGLRRDNKTGYRGVYRSRKKFRAQVKHHGEVIALGTFSTAEEAAAWARAVRLLLFTFNDDDRNPDG
jgi:hypothetical protein